MYYCQFFPRENTQEFVGYAYTFSMNGAPRPHSPKKSFDTWKEVRILAATLFDSRTPMLVKAFVGLALLFGITPIDLLPDFLPFIGQADDLGMLLLAVWTFWQKTPAIREHWRQKFSA